MYGFYFCFETGSYFVAQAGPKLVASLLLSSKPLLSAVFSQACACGQRQGGRGHKVVSWVWVTWQILDLLGLQSETLSQKSK